MIDESDLNSGGVPSIKGDGMFLAALSILLAMAGSLRAYAQDYAGIYAGQTSDSLGGFALFVDGNQNAVLIGGYLYNDSGGDAFYGSCVVDAGGGGLADIGGVTTTFSISPDGTANVSAIADNGPSSFQMQGSRVADGPFLSAAGLYTVSVSAGQVLTAIVSPDGWIYRDSPNYGGGGRVQVTAYGQSFTESSLGHNVNTYILNQNATINLSGAYTLNRVDSLPAPRPSLGVPRADLANGRFMFSAAGLTPGGTNILQSCADPGLANWVSIATNVAAANTMTFTNAMAASKQFYRLIQLP